MRALQNQLEVEQVECRRLQWANKDTEKEKQLEVQRWGQEIQVQLCVDLNTVSSSSFDWTYSFHASIWATFGSWWHMLNGNKLGLISWLSLCLCQTILLLQGTIVLDMFNCCGITSLIVTACFHKLWKVRFWCHISGEV